MSNLTFQFFSAAGCVIVTGALAWAIVRRTIAPLAAVNLGASAIVIVYLASRLVHAVNDPNQIALLVFALTAAAASLAELSGTRMPRALIALQFAVFAIGIAGAAIIAFALRIDRLI